LSQQYESVSEQYGAIAVVAAACTGEELGDNNTNANANNNHIVLCVLDKVLR